MVDFHTDVLRGNKDVAQEAKQESSRLQNALLQLQSQIDSLKQNLAEMRGEKDQLQREITLLKRGQNDNSSGLEERLVKIEQRIATLEPVFFQLDGLEFQADITEKKDFELALASFKKGDFAGSIISFSAFLRKYPDSGFKQSAMFWLASAKYVKREYADVVNQLKSFTGMNESHSKFPEALLTLANSQLELKQTQDAKKTLTELISKFSSSEAAAATPAPDADVGANSARATCTLRSASRSAAGARGGASTAPAKTVRCRRLRRTSGE
jgi:tol-pal system protein YbgF